jgi:DnaK suppressor protein
MAFGVGQKISSLAPRFFAGSARPPDRRRVGSIRESRTTSIMGSYLKGSYDATANATMNRSPNLRPRFCDDGLVDGILAVLEVKRAKLEAELTRLSAPPGETSGISFGKRVGEGTNMAVDRLVQVATHEQMQAVLADVRRALAKLAEDSYGSCDRCGAAISPDRLEILPWAVLCIGCAGQR